MKLFLASSLDKTISLLKQRIPESAKRVVFVANAADPCDERWWVDLDREAFKKHGFKIVEVDLRETDKDQFEQKLKSADILHFCGGSVFYLLSLLKQKDLEGLIVDYVKGDKIIYTGTSAGSIIPSPALDIYKYDTEEGKFYKNESESKGLGLVSFIILPHCNNQDMTENNKNVIEHAHKYSISLLLLHDNQAVWVEGEKLELLRL
ncbi:MAG: Type 1 glutamine amidotransferase-like domain-containing protein [Candidatus Paceibacterota bacterium]